MFILIKRIKTGKCKASILFPFLISKFPFRKYLYLLYKSAVRKGFSAVALNAEKNAFEILHIKI